MINEVSILVEKILENQGDYMPAEEPTDFSEEEDYLSSNLSSLNFETESKNSEDHENNEKTQKSLSNLTKAEKSTITDQLLENTKKSDLSQINTPSLIHKATMTKKLMTNRSTEFNFPLPIILQERYAKTPSPEKTTQRSDSPVKNPYKEEEFLYQEILAAKRRLGISEVELSNAYSKITSLKAEFARSQRENFLEISEKKSERNRVKMKLEMVDAENVRKK